MTWNRVCRSNNHLNDSTVGNNYRNQKIYTVFYIQLECGSIWSFLFIYQSVLIHFGDSVTTHEPPEPQDVELTQNTYHKLPFNPNMHNKYNIYVQSYVHLVDNATAPVFMQNTNSLCTF